MKATKKPAARPPARRRTKPPVPSEQFQLTWKDCAVILFGILLLLVSLAAIGTGALYEWQQRRALTAGGSWVSIPSVTYSSPAPHEVLHLGPHGERLQMYEGTTGHIYFFSTGRDGCESASFWPADEDAAEHQRQRRCLT